MENANKSKKTVEGITSFIGAYAGIPLLGRCIFGEMKKNFNSLDDIVNDSSNPLRAFKVKSNDQDIYVIGVMHSWLTEKTGRYGDYIEKVKDVLIKDAEYIVLEGPDFIYNQSGIEDDILRAVSITIGGVLYPLNAMGFFWDIENELKKYNKKLVVIDPITLHGALTANLPSAFIALYIYYKLQKDELTRRDFLKIALSTAALATMNLPHAASVIDIPNMFDTLFTAEYHGMPRTLTQYDIIDKLTFFNYIADVRNVFIAEGTEKFTEYLLRKGERKKKISLIHGAGHNAVAEYIKEKSKRKLKIELYRIYDFINENSVRIYSYDKSTKKWKLEEKIPY